MFVGAPLWHIWNFRVSLQLEVLKVFMLISMRRTLWVTVTKSSLAYKNPKNPPTPPDRIGFFGSNPIPKRLGMDRGNPFTIRHTWIFREKQYMEEILLLTWQFICSPVWVVKIKFLLKYSPHDSISWWFFFVVMLWWIPWGMEGNKIIKWTSLSWWFILLMAEILHHLGCMKPYK